MKATPPSPSRHLGSWRLKWIKQALLTAASQGCFVNFSTYTNHKSHVGEFQMETSLIMNSIIIIIIIMNTSNFSHSDSVVEGTCPT